MLDFVVSVAREAGDLLQSGFRQQHRLQFKSRAELVTDMDVGSERLIVDRIAARFPDHHIITEEGGGRERRSRWTWLIDPLDGTGNYAHGIAYWAVSISLLQDDALILGVVYDPIHGECFTAERDQPARLNGDLIRVSPIAELRYALISTGFPYERWSGGPSNVPETAAVVLRCQDLRRMGSASLDLCAVAAGRCDGHWEHSLRPWDSAAAALIVQQAGGRMTQLNGDPYQPQVPRVVGTNGLIHDELLAVLAGANDHL